MAQLTITIVTLNVVQREHTIVMSFSKITRIYIGIGKTELLLVLNWKLKVAGLIGQEMMIGIIGFTTSGQSIHRSVAVDNL
jgi:hypothetical protein